jgi:hypothetical protein
MTFSLTLNANLPNLPCSCRRRGAAHSIRLTKSEISMNTTANPKSERVVFRLEPVEKDYLQEQASACGLSLSNFCRQVLLGYSPRERLTKEQLSLFSEVRKLRNDLTHINNYTKRNPDWSGIRQDNEYLISRLDKLLKKGG